MGRVVETSSKRPTALNSGIGRSGETCSPSVPYSWEIFLVAFTLEAETAPTVAPTKAAATPPEPQSVSLGLKPWGWLMDVKIRAAKGRETNATKAE